MIIRPFVFYPLMFIVALFGYGLGGKISTHTTTNNTLKMCNQQPLECKFKYDILMYQETGKIPYTKPAPQPKATEKK